jgi:hypothetical protein
MFWGSRTRGGAGACGALLGCSFGTVVLISPTPRSSMRTTDRVEPQPLELSRVSE